MTQGAFTSATSQRIRALRSRRGWSAEQLASRCASLGAPAINRSVIANIESGRRPYVTIDEVMTFARALDVAPVHLITDPHDEGSGSAQTREWVRGNYALEGTDPRFYFSEVPAVEWFDRGHKR